MTKKQIDPAIQAKRAEETRLVEQMAAKVYNRHLLADCGHICDDETALSRGKFYQPTVRLTLEEAGVIERQETPEPTGIVDREGLKMLLKEIRSAA